MNEQNKNTWMKWMKLYMDNQLLDLISILDDIHANGVSIWLRSLVHVNNNGGRMSLKALLSMLIGKKLSKKKAMELLLASGSFEIDNETGIVSFAGFVKQNFDICSGKYAPAKPLAGGNTPKQIRPNARVSSSLKQQERKENKEKEKKVKKGKERVSELLTLATSTEEKTFYENMLRQYPRICSMDQPLTWEQLQRFRKRGYNDGQIACVLQAMENRADLLKRYLSAALTLANWIKRE